jgi:hypothetical protein
VINTEFIKEWTAELRSGEREQTSGYLTKIDKDGNRSFCCLGVAEDMLCQRGLETSKIWTEENEEIPAQVAYGEQESTGVLTEEAAAFIGIETLYSESNAASNPTVRLPQVEDYHDDQEQMLPEIVSLAELNDSGFTFSQIADVIDYFFGGEK